jgi:hypothetical protein
MLHLEVIDPLNLDLLRRLMREPELAPFYLVGGTALALHLGHRLSADFNLFRDDAFDTRALAESLTGLPGFTFCAKLATR